MEIRHFNLKLCLKWHNFSEREKKTISINAVRVFYVLKRRHYVMFNEIVLNREIPL